MLVVKDESRFQWRSWFYAKCLHNNLNESPPSERKFTHSRRLTFTQFFRNSRTNFLRNWGNFREKSGKRKNSHIQPFKKSGFSRSRNFFWISRIHATKKAHSRIHTCCADTPMRTKSNACNGNCLTRSKLKTK